jgi:hypothetical protein
MIRRALVLGAVGPAALKPIVPGMVRLRRSGLC